MVGRRRTLKPRASQPFRGRSAMDGAESGARHDYRDVVGKATQESKPKDVDRRDPEMVRSAG